MRRADHSKRFGWNLLFVKKVFENAKKKNREMNICSVASLIEFKIQISGKEIKSHFFLQTGSLEGILAIIMGKSIQ